jgi:hypothetical protein
MEMMDKWNRHEVVVDKVMVAFVEVPSNIKQSFHDGVPQEHLKFDSPTVVMLVGQTLRETGFVFGTYQAFADTNFLMRVVVVPEYSVCMVHKGLLSCTGIVVWFSRA